IAWSHMRISARFAKFYDRGRSFNRFNKTRRLGNERQLWCNAAASFKLLRCNSINYNNPLQNLRNILADVNQQREGRVYNELIKIKGREVSHAIPANKHPNETHSLLKTHKCYWIKNAQILLNGTLK
ncbi:hypothetical protein ALC56_12419, partial [Trachymyrmex septentrionalis]